MRSLSARCLFPMVAVLLASGQARALPQEGQAAVTEKSAAPDEKKTVNDQQMKRPSTVVVVTASRMEIPLNATPGSTVQSGIQRVYRAGPGWELLSAGADQGSVLQRADLAGRKVKLTIHD